MLGINNNLSISSDYVRQTDNWSVAFDGSNDFLTGGNVLNLSDDVDFSISIWFRRADDGAHYILGKEQDADNKWLISAGSNESITFQASTSRTVRIKYMTDPTAIADNTTDWNHILVAVDRSDASNSGMWVNGVGMTLATETETGIGVDLDNTGDFKIGEIGGSFFTGNIADVSIWNVAITPSGLHTIGVLRDGTSGVGNAKPSDLSGKSGLVSWYNMGDGDTYPTIQDSAGSNNLTMTNMASDDIEGISV